MKYLLFVVAVLGTFCSSSDGAVIYLETFPAASSTGNSTFSTVGWNAHLGATATNNTTTTANGFVVSNIAGPDGNLGYGAKTTDNGPAVIWTSESGLISQTGLESLTVQTNNTNTTDLYRFVIRIDQANTPANFMDDVWFATDSTYGRVGGATGSANNWSTNAQLKTFDWTTTGASWRDLSFVPDSSMSLASTARSLDLPTGNLTAVGLYVASSTATIRFDNFTINAIPEPSTYLALGFASSLLCVRLCRRKQ